LAVTGLVAGAVPAHAQGCAGAIAEFVKVIDSDAATGNLNKGVHRRMTADLAGVRTTCSAGRDAEATRALVALKSRYGYR